MKGSASVAKKVAARKSTGPARAHRPPPDASRPPIPPAPAAAVAVIGTAVTARKAPSAAEVASSHKVVDGNNSAAQPPSKKQAVSSRSRALFARKSSRPKARITAVRSEAAPPSPIVSDVLVEGDIKVSTRKDSKDAAESFRAMWRLVLDAYVERNHARALMSLFEDPEWVRVRLQGQRIQKRDLTKVASLLVAAAPTLRHDTIRQMMELVTGYHLKGRDVDVIVLRAQGAVRGIASELLPPVAIPEDQRNVLWAVIDSLAHNLALDNRNAAEEPMQKAMRVSTTGKGGDDIIFLEANEAIATPPMCAWGSDEEQEEEEGYDGKDEFVRIDATESPPYAPGVLIAKPEELSRETLKEARGRVAKYCEQEGLKVRRRATLENAVTAVFPFGPSGPPTSVVNFVDDAELPTSFEWISERRIPRHILGDNHMEFLVGCSCKGNCLDNPDCECLKENLSSMGIAPYSHSGIVLSEQGYIIYECNAKCECKECGLRATQIKGRDPVRVQLFRTPYCGWGVRALEPIAAGRFVAEYFGEVISHEEGERRGESYDKDKMSYLFDIDFHVEDDESNEKVLVIDAADCGNVSRFLNHSHDPNLVIYSVESESARKDLLRLCFIAVRDILPFEELTFDYRYQLVDDEEGAIPCHCGAVNCTGRLR